MPHNLRNNSQEMLDFIFVLVIYTILQTTVVVYIEHTYNEHTSSIMVCFPTKVI